MPFKKKEKIDVYNEEYPNYQSVFFSDDTIKHKKSTLDDKSEEKIDFKEIVKDIPSDIIDYNEIYDRKYDQVCWLAAHNAFASLKYRWIYNQQSITYDDMFNMGVRGFLIDVHWNNYGSSCNGTKSRELALMHSSNKFLNVVAQRQGPPPKFTTFLEKLKEWLYQYPNDIITVFLESYTGKDGKDEMKKLFKEYDIWDDLYIHEFGEEWPTIGDLIEDDTRLIIFTNNYQEPFNHKNQIVANHWDYSQYPDGNMIIGNNNSDNVIFQFNHFHPVSLDAFRSYSKFNNYENIIRRANNSMNQTGKIPNFVCLDFVHKGDGMKTVNSFNKMFEKLKNGLPKQLSSKLEN